MAAQTPPLSSLREFCPLYSLLNSIPGKVQRGFRSVLVYLTALDASADYVAVGSSVGMLYLYCRRVSHMNKYSLEGKCEAITAVKLLSCFDDLVAVGTASGRVALFQLVSQLPGRNKQLRRFDVLGQHRSTVTALAWSPNGMKLFSGDDKGRVVYSAVDLDQGVCNPVLLCEEASSIVQLEYSQKVLLISTHQRSLLLHTQDQNQNQNQDRNLDHNLDHNLQQLGTKPRKSSGKFGACFQPGLCKQSDLQVLAARPGLRLWRTDVCGVVEDTRVLKPLFVQDVPQFQLLPRAAPSGACRPADRQLGLLCCFLRDGCLLSWNEYSVYVLDCLNQMIVGALESDGDIVSVSCTENEIFILKGDRDIVRISTSPEGTTSYVSDPSLHLSSPLTTPTTLLPPTGAVETAQPIRTMAVIVEQRGGARRGGGEEEEEGVEEVEEAAEEEEEAELSDSTQEGAWPRGSTGGATTSDSPRSRSSSVTSWDSGQGGGAASSPARSRYSAPPPLEDLVVRPIRVKKKARRRRRESGGGGNRLSENSSWSEGTPGLPDGGGGGGGGRGGGGGGGGGTPTSDQLSDCTSLACSSLDLESNDRSPPGLDRDQNRDQDQDQDRDRDQDQDRDPAAQSSCSEPSQGPPDSAGAPLPPCPPACLPLQATQPGSYPEKEPPAGEGPGPDAVPTPDVDLLLECTFSYMQASEEQQPMEQQQEDEFPSPPIGPEDSAEAEPEPEDPDPRGGGGGAPERMDLCPSSDEEDIYAHGGHSGAGLATGPDPARPQGGAGGAEQQEDGARNRTDQLAESWMGYSGPGCGILSLAVTDRLVWCLDFRGGLYCSALPDGGLRWQRFEDNVHQVAVSPSGALLWKVEQKSMTAYACGKVTVRGKRHWYKALDHAAFVALSDDSAWIIRTNGDLYLQTGLSGERPCARAVQVECPCPLAQVAARGGVVWALSEQRAVFYREGLSSFCSEGEGWKYDKISEGQGLEPLCLSLGARGTAWALDTRGSLWFRTGVTASKPQGDDQHWWQVSITDYAVFDQGSLFQTLLAASASVERVAECLRVAFLSQTAPCQPCLLSAGAQAVWVASGRNHLHQAKGSLVGTFWQGVVPRGTVSATKWAFITSSSVSSKEGSFLWLGQSRRDLFCVWDQDGQLRPSTVQLPPDVELAQLAACRDALWGLDLQGRVHIRTLSPTCPSGMAWTRLDLSQLGSVRLVGVACGSQHVWAVDSSGMVYFRVGTQPLNTSMMLPAWICIEPPEQPVGIHLVSVHTSPNDRMLWALDNRGSVHVRTGLSDEMPVGTAWEHVPGLQAGQLVLSLRTVWVRCPNGEVARRYGVTDRNPAGDYWKKIPGLVHCFTVTALDDLWAVGTSGGLIHRLTKTLLHGSAPPAGPAPSALSTDDLEEEEWEVI